MSKLVRMLSGFFFVIVLVTLYAWSSPLSKGNGWVDTNAMLEVGRLWLNGHVPFRDVFEQRGPVMYFIYLLANTISTKGYIGLYVLEIVNLLAVWVATILSLNVWVGKNSRNYLISLLMPLLIISSSSFFTGGSPDEFSGFWFICGFWLLGNILLKEQPTTSLLLNSIGLGIVAGVVFWLKYVLIGQFVGMLIFLVVYSVWRKKYEYLGTFFIGGLLGIAIITLPIALYYVLTAGYESLINTYFITNLTTYESGKTSMDRLVTIVILPLKYPVQTALYVISSWYMVKKDKKLIVSLMFLCFVVFMLMIYGMGVTFEYSFGTPLVVMAVQIIYSASMATKNIRLDKPYMTVFIVALAFVLPYLLNPNARIVPYVFSNRTLAAEEYGEVINKNVRKGDKPTLIYYNHIDNGVERFFDSGNSYRFFEKTNISNEKFPAQGEFLERLVSKKTVDYVVLRVYPGQSVASISPHLAKITVQLNGLALCLWNVSDRHCGIRRRDTPFF